MYGDYHTDKMILSIFIHLKLFHFYVLMKSWTNEAFTGISFEYVFSSHQLGNGWLLLKTINDLLGMICKFLQIIYMPLVSCWGFCREDGKISIILWGVISN
jgi:hypothetical protein